MDNKPESIRLISKDDPTLRKQAYFEANRVKWSVPKLVRIALRKYLDEVQRELNIYQVLINKKNNKK